MLRFSYETLTNSWFYGEWIVKIIAKVMILIIHFVLHKKRRETMKDDKKEKSEQRYMERPAHQRQGSEYKTGDGSGKCKNYDRKL